MICNIYRLPTGNLGKAVTYLEEMLHMFDLSKVEIYMLGDMNVNYKNKSSCDFKKLNFFIKANGLTQVIENTPRNTNKTKSLLDIVLTNSKYISRAGTLDHFISDHQPVFVVKKKGRDHIPKVEFKGRSYRNYDRKIFEQELLAYDWEHFYDMNDPEEAWAHFLDRITPVLDRMCPIRTFQIKNYRPDWVTNELIEQVQDRDYFYRQAKLTRDEDAWNIARHLRNLTNANIRQARKDFITSKLEQNSTDYKKFWKTIRSMIPDSKGSTTQEIMLSHNGKKLPKKEVAPYINSYFINIGKNTAATSQNSGVDPDADVPQPRAETEGLDKNKWCFSKIRQTDVFKVVKSINISKSSGISDISSFALNPFAAGPI